MTIKKLSMSAIAAATLATTAFAGTVAVNEGGLVSKELVSIKEVSITSIDNNATYKPSDIPATSLKNPIFKFTFANLKNIVAGSTTAVYEYKDNNDSNNSDGNVRLVADNAEVSGTNDNIVSFNAISSDIYAYNGRTYRIMENNVTKSAVTGKIAKGSNSDVTLLAELYSGDSQSRADGTTAVSLYTIDNEFSASVSQKLNAQIDAAASFMTFDNSGEDVNATTSNVKDTLKIAITRKPTISGLDTPVLNTVVFHDQNLTANDYDASTKLYYNAANPAATFNDMNITASSITAAAAVATAKDMIVEYVVDGKSSKIEETLFGLQMNVTSADSTEVQHDLIVKTVDNAGEWTVYGYKAQIPNVAGLSTHETVMKFTNRSTLDTNIYFTLIDPDGTVVTLNSVDNTELAKLPANTTGTYKASDLVALVEDAEFNKTGSISVEVSIPTTPTQVYGMASFKNNALGQFKDLPVYNSSSMSY